ncbi:VirB4-like conjugal transfer ATPase, CD1110 family [Streptococcus suis]|uniref:VirB4-like conjugal transfer ATPase, CD1110 family n=1 Tax=Streptococcus suis TaxID=1307 RepID=UPI0037571B6D
MNLKLTKAEKQRKRRLQRQMKASTQNSIFFTSLHENGLMHLAKNDWSRTYRLGDVAYTSANKEDKVEVIDTYAEALNSLDAGNNFQLLVLNKRIETNALEGVLYKPKGDAEDLYREEYNQIITERFSADSRNFKVEKYITLSTQAYDFLQADIQLHEIGGSVRDQFAELNIDLDDMTGLDRLKILNWMLRGQLYFPYSYKDIALSGLRAKDFISPSRIHFLEDRMKIDDFHASVLYVRQYPTWLTDRMIKTLTDIGIELAITVHANPYDPGQFTQKLLTAQSQVKVEMIKNQREGAQAGILDPELAVSGVAKETNETTKRWKEETMENDQKAFSGVIAVYIMADSQEELKSNEDKVKAAGRKLGVVFDHCYYYQEQGLNTVLPLGYAYLDVKQDFMRPFTTANVATQIPFTNVDLQSKSKRALYYGQNQLSHNVITLDRKELNAPNGVIIGSSGSGKGTTAKTTEVIPTILERPEDKIIIADPEGEYTKIAEAFGGTVIDITTRSKTHINLLELPDTDEQLFDDDDAEIDVIADKSNLLMSLFESVLKEVTDDHVTIIDRVTSEVYRRFEKPTLKDWQTILEEQPEEAARDLATKAEIYTRGSLDLFAYPTNVDLSNRLVVFNLKGLSKKLKPFALLVLQDYIWQQVVSAQGRQTIWLYWDELHLTFRNPTDATFFTEVWARIRKYGGIPTGITQNIGTIVRYEEGRNLLSNCEFMILLKHKPQDLEKLKQVLDVPEALEKYITRPKQKGSGLIVAGSTIVPFENPIPKDTKLFDLAQTDA